ncbi:TetR/AcrR family transcriptional regulator [Paraconexibacter sp.]|uniref:TetR/AcrR family transcriptional regulator n=1 Tax=Paraconexibacter sp. TaxID=2949640 RepID=UPI0035620524
MRDAPGRRYAGRTATERATDRRRAFLDAGLELFGTRAYDEVSVADLVAESGQTRRSFYELFDDREGLLLAVHDEVVAGQVRAIVEAAGDPPASLRAADRATRAFVDYYAQDSRRAHVQYVAVVGVSRAMEEHRRRMFRTIAARLGEWLGPAAGDDGPARRRSALAFSGAVSELLMDWLWAQDEPLEAIRDEVLALLRARFFPAPA